MMTTHRNAGGASEQYYIIPIIRKHAENEIKIDLSGDFLK